MKTSETTARSNWSTLRTLSAYLWPRGRADLRLRVVIAMLSLLGAKAISVYIPFLYKRAVDSLTGPDLAVSLAVGFTVAYGGARILSQFFGEFRDFVFARVAQHAQRTIALHTFRHLHQLSLAFHLDRQIGGLSRVIERGTRGIQFVLNFMLFNILPTLLEIVLVTIVLYWQYPSEFSLVIFVTIVVYVAFTLGITDWRLKYRKEMNQTDTTANTKAIDSLLNYETVKYFNNEEHEYRRFDHALQGYEKAAVQSQASLSFLNVGQGLIIGVGLVIVMVLSARQVAEKAMTVGDFVLVNTYLIQLYLPLNFLGFVYREIKQSLIDMEKMFELLAVNADISDVPGAEALRVHHGEVEFDHVSFDYGGPDATSARPILTDVSFKVPAGQTYAIVGPSGAGKSTLARLLFRFYDVKGGTIRIDGQDIRRVKQSSLRSVIGIVPQDTVLFNDTLGYNILYGRPNASVAEVERAADFAKLAGFIEKLPKKMETAVGERGLKLSGGEKQRVAIARTILKNPRILLFDEATSALDSHTEKEIQKSLDEVSSDRTTLVIAHRLSTIVNADQILVLKDGQIVERGRHAELLARGGEYAHMWAKQQEAREAQSRLENLQQT
ncbi:MAG: ABC transporter ATP-binding protein/permease [Bacteriovoracia bacterium]